MSEACEITNKKANTTEKRIREFEFEKQEIRDIALNNLTVIQKTEGATFFKQKTQNQVIFGAIWYAYVKHGYVIDPKFLIAKIGKEEKRISYPALVEKFKYLNDGKFPEPYQISQFYIEMYIEEMKIKNKTSLEKKTLVPEVMQFVKKCCQEEDISDWAWDNDIKNSVVGIICFYLSRDNSFNMTAFSKAVLLTSACINKYKGQFAEIYNQ